MSNVSVGKVVEALKGNRRWRSTLREDLALTLFVARTEECTTAAVQRYFCLGQPGAHRINHMVSTARKLKRLERVGVLTRTRVDMYVPGYSPSYGKLTPFGPTGKTRKRGRFIWQVADGMLSGGQD